MGEDLLHIHYSRVSPSSITRLDYILINYPKPAKRIESELKKEQLFSMFIVSLLDKNVRGNPNTEDQRRHKSRY